MQELVGIIGIVLFLGVVLYWFMFIKDNDDN